MEYRTDIVKVLADIEWRLSQGCINEKYDISYLVQAFLELRNKIAEAESVN